MINFHTQAQVDTTLSFINFPKLKKRYADNLSIIFVANMYFSLFLFTYQSMICIARYPTLQGGRFVLSRSNHLKIGLKLHYQVS